MGEVTMAEANTIISDAVSKATGLSVPVNIAVLDPGTHLKVFARMDGAVLGSVDIAMEKARTAALFRMNSEELFEFCKPGGTSFGLERTNGGLVVFAGGRPLYDPEGEVIGAVGVSGGSVPQDDAIAKAAAAGFSGPY